MLIFVLEINNELVVLSKGHAGDFVLHEV